VKTEETLGADDPLFYLPSAHTGFANMIKNLPSKASVLQSVILQALAPSLAAAETAALTAADAHQRAETLLKQMTVDEKVGQLNQVSGIVDAKAVNDRPDDLIAQGKVGSVLWITDVKEINRLQHLAVDQSRVHIPILFGYDVIHGYRTVFPVPLGMASS
jgi:beta-glucosidase